MKRACIVTLSFQELDYLLRLTSAEGDAPDNKKHLPDQDELSVAALAHVQAAYEDYMRGESELGHYHD